MKMKCKKAANLYNKFIMETETLFNELVNLDNYIRVPFKAFWYLFDMDTASWEKQMRFNGWKTKTTLGFYEVVHSCGLNWSETHDGWYVLPFNVGDLPYEYDLDVDTLVDILTDGALRCEDCGYYDVYEFDEYVKEIYNEDEAIEVFKCGLERIKLIREDKIPNVKTLCEELREYLDTRKLLEDCEKYVLEVRSK